MIEIDVGRPAVLEPGTEPDVGFLPPLLRRRCGRLTRMMLHVAYGACDADGLGALPVVFASRYGDVAATLSLLETLARREPLTAAGFSHSVHNAPAGLFSIAAGNRSLASAVAAGDDTFAASFLEAVAAMRRTAQDRALLVVADERLPGPFARFQEPPGVAYAVAMVLGRPGVRLGFEPGVGRPPAARTRPDALEFARWLESDQRTLTLGARTPYTWTRLGP